jgi:hypothetical protein
VRAGWLACLGANRAPREASTREQAERWGRYRSNIAAASTALQLQHSGAARSALEDAPQEHRNWEWQYLHSQLDGASLVLAVPGGKVMSLVLSPSGRQIAVCCLDHNEVYLYEVATGRLEAVLRGHSGAVKSVAYRPACKQIATASNDQTIRLWDPATGQQTALLKADVAQPDLDRNPGLAYDSDGSRIASYAPTRFIAGAGASRLWDATTGLEIAVLGKWQELGPPVAFSPDGKRVAVGSGSTSAFATPLRAASLPFWALTRRWFTSWRTVRTASALRPRPPERVLTPFISGMARAANKSPYCQWPFSSRCASAQMGRG